MELVCKQCLSLGHGALMWHSAELPPPQKYYPNLLRSGKIASSFPLMALMVSTTCFIFMLIIIITQTSIVVITTLCVLALRLYIQEKGSDKGGRACHSCHLSHFATEHKQTLTRSLN
jgi:hypothetical protein